MLNLQELLDTFEYGHKFRIRIWCNNETAQFFLAIGMHCLGCPASRGESVADACAVHGTDADALIAKINAFLADRQK